MDIRTKLGLYRDNMNMKPAGVSKAGRDVQDLIPGRVIGNEFGSLYEIESRYPACERHGVCRLDEILNVRPEILSILNSDGRFVPVERMVFLDTETTGLSGGAGTVAFLVGTGFFEGGDFVVRQYLMRDYDEEAAMLHQLDTLLAGCSGLVTFNGKAFDWNLLEGRFIANRIRPALSEPVHTDLLYPSRRIWRLKLESCRLSSLEENILGVCREDDIPGALIPGVYFKYLEDRDASELKRVIKHNELDILSMVSLAARISAMLEDPLVQADGGHELLGIGMIYRSKGDYDRMENCLETCSRSDIPAIRMTAEKSLAGVYKRSGRYDKALEYWRRMASGAGIFNILPYVELAIHYEHKEKDYQAALECVEKAIHMCLETGMTDGGQFSGLRKRQERLRRKAAGNDNR